MKQRYDKKLLSICLIFSALLAVVSELALVPEPVSAKGVMLAVNKAKVYVKKGKTVRIKIIQKKVKKIVSAKWSSGNKKVATVNQKGVVKGKKNGKSTLISCKVNYIAKGAVTISKKMLKCKVIVGQKKKAAKTPTKKPAATSTPANSLAPTPTQQQEEKGKPILPVVMEENRIVRNPYLSSGKALIHNDNYSSDVTAEAMPLGICPEITQGTVAGSVLPMSGFIYDNYGNAVCSYDEAAKDGAILAGGVAIRDMDSPELEVEGKFVPFLHDDGAQYEIQASYSFVDKDNYLVVPTSDGHIMMLKTCGEDGNVLPVFEKRLDVNVETEAIKHFGSEIEKDIISAAYDYDGNLWFVTGGFHKDPAHSKAGFVGYLERRYIDSALAGQELPDVGRYLHYKQLSDGENAENGISTHADGCVVLTNRNCYLLSAGDSAVNEKWKRSYESRGGKAADAATGITGAGLAWGSGSTPALTNDLVCFTDNQDTVNLIAIDIKSGEEVVKTPLLNMGGGVKVSVENSLNVYDAGSGRTSVLACNWYGAGNASLFENGLQLSESLYDAGWLAHGSSYLMPGIERVDVIRQDDGSYAAQRVWLRDDLKNTSMMKLSTATGCYYGYTQNESTLEWGFIALDYETGKTVLWQPVSALAGYNNRAAGIIPGNNGNSIYCPTNSQALVRMQDRFAYLPEDLDKKLDIGKMERSVISKEQFEAASGSSETPATYLLSAAAEDVTEKVTLSFRFNGMDGNADGYKVYYMTEQGTLKETSSAVITDTAGRALFENERMAPEEIYEVRIQAEDGGAEDMDEAEGKVKAAVILAK